MDMVVIHYQDKTAFVLFFDIVGGEISFTSTLH